jgi:uncharacterized protein YydD (DUF2326 family)
MIHRIYSTLTSFKELTFKPGLNVLLADKSDQSTSKHTRNGAGKSSVLEIVHFLSAADCPEGSIFRAPELSPFRFGMEFDLGGRTIRVERSGSSPNDFIITGGDTTGWPVQPELSKAGERVLTQKNWDRVLGAFMFRLDEQILGKAKMAYSPTFRSLFPYFVRRHPGGFTEPHLHFVQSKPANWQVAISYLLGLDWTIPQEWQVVRDEEDEIRKLKAAVGSGDLADIVGKRAQLRSEIVTAENASNKFRERIDGFQVLSDFREYEHRASQLTRRLSEISDANTLDVELAEDLERAIAEEKPPEIVDLERAYQEAGVTLPGVALKRFEEVRNFHESVIANRKSYLSGELDAARQRIAARDSDARVLDGERQRLMTILKSHGALEQFVKLQDDFGRRVADLELLRKRFAAAEKIEAGLSKLKIRRQELLLRLKQDYTEEAAVLGKAIVTFEEISAQLYQKAAKFTPTETQNGPEFRIEVEGERSPGIGNMQIFCFDMMLSLIATDRKLGPGFLMHDSHLFDPVDARQVGTALKLGAELSASKQFQYIVTLNSDKQVEAPPDFNLLAYEMPIKLTDADESGGLFGLRFG